jgi:hypothetical protein
MKIVREHINEKFVEDSDPIQDMGIGIIEQIQDFLKGIDMNIDEVHPLVLINEFIKNKKYDYADFYIDYKHVDINGPPSNYGYLLRNAVYNDNWNGQKYLIQKGANLEETIKQTIESVTPITYRKLKELKYKLEKFEDS